MSAEGFTLGFVLLAEPGFDAEAYTAAAGELGEPMWLTKEDPHYDPAEHEEQPGAVSFELANAGGLIFMEIEAPHPDAASMPGSPLAPSPEAIAAHKAHLIVTGIGIGDDAETADARLSRLLAAVSESAKVVGLMHGHGAYFLRPDLWNAMVAETPATTLAPELCVSITAAPEGEGRMSFMTHGLQRYGREEFYVVCGTGDGGHGGYEFIWGMARWMLADRSKELPTGDTIGRTEDEKIQVERVPSPANADAPPVIRLQLP